MKLSEVFAVNLRRVRNDLRWSQERLAEVADISREYVSRLENGGENVTINMIERLAQAMKQDARVFLEPLPRRTIKVSR